MSIKKKRVFILAACAALCLGLFAQGSAAEKVVKLGWVGSLTGDQAIWGQCELNTVKMMAEELNAAGGLLGAKV